MNFDMGSYSAYVWPAYGVSAVLLIGVTVWAVAGWKRAKARLAVLENRDPPKKMTAKT